MSSKITCIFRYDDYTATSPLEIEKKLFDLFRKYDLQITVGVVPFITAGDYHDSAVTEFVEFSEEKIAYLKSCIQNGSVDAALHGFYHRSNRLGKLHSEFAQAESAEQCDKIKRGKEFLEKTFRAEVRSFIPPWNTYDQQTLLCLKENNIACISANRYGCYAEDSSMFYAPITIEFHELDKALLMAAESKDDAPVIAVLLHPYDFENSGDKRASIKWNVFEKKVQELSRKEDVQIMSVAQALNNKEVRLDTARYRANQPVIIESIYPPFVPVTYNEPVYFSEKIARKKHKKKIILTILFYILFASVFFAGGILFRRVFAEQWANAAGYLFLLLFVLMGIKGILRKEVYFKGMCLMVASISLFLGLIL
ncbi:MAG TPA: DUF2334 domain-containing protein [Caldithrix abyssi]|uniref:DUF2334 domain-containing protein n=1 Tax=Caldithrix abyssi TaxID=187145 RepID=A0A7V4U257_CALAY|nr:DUF2334 domain-containing protein [Caldithrix abyssi]